MKPIIATQICGISKYFLAIMLVFLAACDTSTPPTNQNPVASFLSSSETEKAGTAFSFTSTSIDPDGDALTQSWDFGDGLRGGGVSLAHVYSSAGTFSTKLTVTDGRGGISSSQKTVTVTAGISSGANLSVVGTITDLNGVGLAGVSIKLGTEVLGSSDTNGKITVSLATGIPLSLTLSKDGFAENILALEFPIGSNASNADFKASLMPRAAAQNLDSSVGGAITGTDNARLELPANALVNSSGTAVSGNVNISLSPIDVNDPKELKSFPGSFEGVQANGSNTGIVTLGTTEFALSQNGERLNLKPGSSAKVRLPIYADSKLDGSSLNLGDSIALWSLNEKTGDWVQEGTGVIVDAGGGTRALEATVTHFSWWNADMGFTPSNPKPKCIQDVPGQYDSIFEQAVYCKFLAEMDKGIPEQKTRQTNPRLPSFAATSNILIAGNSSLAVPAGVNIRYTGCIANGAFCGSVVKNFAAGASESFEIRLKPTNTQTVNLPYDAVLNINQSQRIQFDSLATPNGVSISVERGSGSSLNASATLFDPNATELAKTSLGATPQTLEKQLFGTGKHTLEIVPLAGSSGLIRVQISRKNFSNLSTWKPVFQTPNYIESTPNSSLRLKVNSAGSGAAIWSHKDNSTPALYFLSASTYDANADTFDAAATLETSSNVVYSALAIGANNDKFVVWNKYISSTSVELRFSRRASNSSTWSASALIASNPANFVISGVPEIEADANGNATVVWLEYQSQLTFSQLRSARFTASTGLWEVSTLVPYMAAFGPATPSLGMDANGNMTALYAIGARSGANSSYPTAGFYAHSYNVTTNTWSKPVFITGIGIAAPNDFYLPQIEISSNGNALAIWSKNATISSFAFNAATNLWRPLNELSGNTPKLGVDASGNAMLVYQQFTNPGGIQSSQLANSSNTWTNPQLVSVAGNADRLYGFTNNSSGDTAVTFGGNVSQFSARALNASVWTAPTDENPTGSEVLVALDDSGKALLLRYRFEINQFILESKRVSVR